MNPPLPMAAPPSGLQGHLELVCARDPQGRSYLARQSFCAPIHLSKPYLDEGALVVNVVNPTAGLLAGDRIRIQAEVQSGARLLLCAPSACRAHRMREGWAELSQHFSVAKDAQLEIWPELFIPQAGTRFRQRSTIELEAGAELLFFEILTPGRVAAGEAFAYESLQWQTDIRLAGQLIARERYHLCPTDESLAPLRAQFEHAYYASCFFISSRLKAGAEPWSAIDALHSPDLWLGWSALAPDAWVIKLVASGSIPLRRALAEIRTQLYRSLGQAPPAIRR